MPDLVHDLMHCRENNPSRTELEDSLSRNKWMTASAVLHIIYTNRERGFIQPKSNFGNTLWGRPRLFTEGRLINADWADHSRISNLEENEKFWLEQGEQSLIEKETKRELWVFRSRLNEAKIIQTYLSIISYLRKHKNSGNHSGVF